MGCRAAPPQARARGGAFSAPAALAARRRGVWKRRKSLARGPELSIDRFGPHGPCETCAESSGSRSREFGGGCEFWREERLGSDLPVFRV